MIKKYCDRCEKEIKEEHENIYDAFMETLADMLDNIMHRGKKYILCIDGKKPKKLTLCKECNEALQRFMQKTEIQQIALEKSPENEEGGDEND